MGYRPATDDLEKGVLKGTCWLLLKNSDNLDIRRDEHYQSVYSRSRWQGKSVSVLGLAAVDRARTQNRGPESYRQRTDQRARKAGNGPPQCFRSPLHWFILQSQVSVREAFLARESCAVHRI